MKHSFPKLQTVSSEAEGSRRRWFFKVLAFEMSLAALVVVAAAIFHNGPAVAACVSLLMLCNFYLLWNGVQLSALNWSARQKLRKGGYRVCPECTYDLAASAESGKCPECGTDYDPASLKERWEASYKKMLEKVGS
jgi:ssDNA-binding Zn-finger/Zn-ribbon topoisomerase 1